MKQHHHMISKSIRNLTYIQEILETFEGDVERLENNIDELSEQNHQLAERLDKLREENASLKKANAGLNEAVENYEQDQRTIEGALDFIVSEVQVATKSKMGLETEEALQLRALASVFSQKEASVADMPNPPRGSGKVQQLYHDVFVSLRRIAEEMDKAIIGEDTV